MTQAILQRTDGAFEERGIDPVQLPQLLGGPTAFVWLDLDDPANVGPLRDQLGLHELAIEDAQRGRQRPKLDQYEGHSFFVLYAARYDDGELFLHEINCFAGPRYLITVHRGAMPELEEVKQRWQNNERISHGPSRLLYALLDTVVDGYFPVIDRISDELDGLEASVFASRDQLTLQQLFARRKDLLALRRIIAPERDLLNMLLRGDLPLAHEQALPYLQDVYDHLLRQLEAIDLYRDLLSNVLDVYLSAASHSLNIVVRRLTALTLIVMVPTLIAGIYGMNFRYMPELEWSWGYYGALGLMALSAGLLALLFRWLRWL